MTILDTPRRNNPTHSSLPLLRLPPATVNGATLDQQLAVDRTESDGTLEIQIHGAQFSNVRAPVHINRHISCLGTQNPPDANRSILDTSDKLHRHHWIPCNACNGLRTSSDNSNTGPTVDLA